MWMSSPTPVTTRAMVALSGSKRNPTGAANCPAASQEYTYTSAARIAGGSSRSPSQHKNTVRNDSATIPHAMTLTSRLLSRAPKAALSANPTRGKNGMSQVWNSRFTGRLPLQQVQVADLNGPLFLVDRDDDRQADGDFRSRHQDH